MNIYKRLPAIIHKCLGTSDDPFISVGLDYSKFDSSLQPFIIEAAFSIIEDNINISEDMQQWALHYSRHYFLHRPVVMPDGRMWLTHMGLPSGSYFRQLVGSIANHFSISYLQLKTYGRTFPTYVLGDDSLFGIPYSMGYPDIAQMSNIAKTLGLTIHPEKANVATRADEVIFLGHSARQLKVRRDALEVFKLLIFTEQPVPGPHVSLARLNGLLMDTALNTPALTEFYRYVTVRARELGYTISKHFQPEDINWAEGVLGLRHAPSQLDPTTIWLIT